MVFMLNRSKISNCLHYSLFTNISCKYLFLVPSFLHILQARANTANINEIKCMRIIKHKKCTNQKDQQSFRTHVSPDL